MWKNERDRLPETFNHIVNVDMADFDMPEEIDVLNIEGEEEYTDPVFDIDYSMLRGPFNKNIRTVKHKIKNTPIKLKKKKPLNKEFFVKDKERINIVGGSKKQIGRVIVPRDREVMIAGISDFILSDKPEKKIGYYKGEKLKELILTIDNTNGDDFVLEMFNPSMPLDYLQSTSGNINSRITVASSNRVTYTDLMFNILANPMLIPNARFIATGADVEAQKRQSLVFTSKSAEGETRVAPLQLNLNQDVYQLQTDVILFDIQEKLNRPYIPDGMDIIKYTVLAGNSVNFVFYYKQKQIKKMFYKEAREKILFQDELKELL